MKRTLTWLKKHPVDFLSVLILLCVLVLALQTTRNAANILDSDTSSELVLAHLLNEQGGILSADWGYSTELRVINTNLIYAPLFSLFHSWHTVRVAGSLIMQLFLLLSWFFLGRQLGCRLRGLCLGGALLLLPMSIGWGRIVLYGCYYMPHITQCFLLTGGFLLWGKCRRQRSRILLGIALFLGAVLAGTGGVRQLMNTALPLVLAVALRFLLNPADLQRLKREALPCLLIALGCLIGYLICSKLLMQRYVTRNDYTAQSTGLATADGVWEILTSWLKQFGLSEGVAVFSLYGLIGLAAAAAGVAVPCLAVFALRRRVQGAKGFAAAFMVSSLTVSAAVFLLLSAVTADCVRFWLVPFAWVIPFLMTPEAREDLPEAAGKFCLTPRRLFSGFAAVTLLLSGVSRTVFFAHPDSSPLPYDALFYDDPLQRQHLEGAVSYMKEQGVTLCLCLGAADCWGGNVITEMSDGQIATSVLYYREDEIRRSLNDRRILSDPSQLEDPGFCVLILNLETEAFLSSDYNRDMQIVYQDDFFTVMRCSDPVEVFGAACR